MNRSLRLLFVLLAMVPGLCAEELSATRETQLFIAGQTDVMGEIYGSVAEETDLRGLLTKQGVAAHIVLEVKPDRVVTNLSLLRKDDAGKISLADIRFSELMHLSLTWAVAKPGELNRELVRRQVYGFMQMAEAYLAADKVK